MKLNLFLGDSLHKLKELAENSVDSIVTDPPYGLNFMNKKWDYDVPSKELWQECLRVLKPGGHLLSFGGTRTYHRLVVNIEDAGFEVRDMITWNYGSGFPKSTNVLKSGLKQGLFCECENRNDMLDMREEISSMEMLGETNKDASLQLRMQRSESRQRVGEVRPSRKQSENKRELSKGCHGGAKESSLEGRSDLQAHQGKLYRSEICEMPEGILRNVTQGRLCNGAPLDNGNTSQSNSSKNRSGSPQRSQHSKQSHQQSGIISEQSSTQACGGCGKTICSPGLGTALKPALEPICFARKPLEKGLTVAENVLKYGTGGLNIDGTRIGTEILPAQKAGQATIGTFERHDMVTPERTGRWPANIILDEEAAAILDEQSGALKSGAGNTRKKPHDTNAMAGRLSLTGKEEISYGDHGGASRFFYVAKASKRERNAGLEGMPLVESGIKNDSGRGFSKSDPYKKILNQNFHPTVKPIKLMEYLIKLVTPVRGTVLDPFMGSGSTGVAAKNLGFGFVGIELSEEYLEIAKKRIGA